MTRPPGSRTWFFPDGDIPAPGDGELRGHESLVVLNPGDVDAEVLITVFYEDREPDVLPVLSVMSRRVRCIRTDQPIDGHLIPFGQYALRLESSVPVVCQIGRMDVRQPNLAYYTVLGYAID